jgi:hypothetical protein
MRDLVGRAGVLGELMQFLWKRKLYWLIPVMITLALFALLIVVAGSGPLSAFLYPIW